MTKTNKPLKPPKAPLKAQATLEAPEPPKDKARQKSHLALAVARDLAFRLLERRPLSPSHLTAALTEFAKVGQVIIKNSANPGIPLLRLAGSLTAAEIDKGWLSNAGAAAEKLAANAALIMDTAQTIPTDVAKEILPLAISLVIKLIETNSVSLASLEGALTEIVQTLSGLGEEAAVE